MSYYSVHINVYTMNRNCFQTGKTGHEAIQKGLIDQIMHKESYLQNSFKRRNSVAVRVGNVTVGGSAPIVVQSMTDTDTADIDSTVKQVIALYRAGSELVRITIDRDESAAAVPHICERLEKLGFQIPLIGDFHYIGHRLLTEYPTCAGMLAKYRVNPGNVGFKEKRNKQFSDIIETAIYYNKPVRIGVNWGSLDQELLAKLMDDNSGRNSPLNATEIMRETVVQSALKSAELAELIGLEHNKIILSAKVSQIRDLIAIYTILAKRCDYAIHLGLTEAGVGLKGIVASSAAMGILLQQGIGDTIRISLTPEPSGDRVREVRVAQDLLQVLGLRTFSPVVVACPGCGRTKSTSFRELACKIQDYVQRNMPIWQHKYPGVESMQIAVMGCIVNGPGESKRADVGISLPGIGETQAAVVFSDGKKIGTLRGDNVDSKFEEMLSNYIKKRFCLNNNA